jgi:hypothetical protein
MYWYGALHVARFVQEGVVRKPPSMAIILDKRGYHVSNKGFLLMKYPEPYKELSLTRGPLLQCEVVAQLSRSHTSRTRRDRRRYYGEHELWVPVLWV